MRRVPLHAAKDDLSKYLRDAEKEEIVITRHGKPAGVLIGFSSEDDWFEYRLEHDPRFHFLVLAGYESEACVKKPHDQRIKKNGQQNTVGHDGTIALGSSSVIGRRL